MRWLIIFLVLLFPSASGLNVVISMPDFEPIVKEIGGNAINTSIILPPASDPHSFSLTTDDIERIKKADLIVLANSNLLSYERDIIKNYNGNYVDFEDYEKNGATLLNFGDFEDNPHGYWMEVNNSIAIAITIEKKMEEMMPEKKDELENNLYIFINSVKNAEDVSIELAKERGIYGKRVVAMVPGVCYIAKNLGMNASEILLTEGSANVDIQKLQEVEMGLKKGDYIMILVPEFLKNAKAGDMARQIAEDTNCSIAYVRFAVGGESYLSLFYHNTMEILSSKNSSLANEKSNMWTVGLIISLLFLIFVEGFVLYECRRGK